MALTTEEKLSKGYIHINAILEMVGKPKEHVEATFAEYIANMKKSLKYEVLADTVHEVIPVDDSENLFSSFAEVEVLVKNMGALYDFCFECMPASVDVIAPSELKLRPSEASASVNDLLGRIHQVDLQSKQMVQQNLILSQNVRIAIQNSILLFLAQKPYPSARIADAVGLAVDQLGSFIDPLVAQNQIVKIENDMYAIAGVPIVTTNKNQSSQPHAHPNSNHKSDADKISSLLQEMKAADNVADEEILNLTQGKKKSDVDKSNVGKSDADKNQTSDGKKK